MELCCNVSSGTEPYTLYVKKTEGTLVPVSGPTRSSTITTDAFDGENPSGKWTVYIQNSGVSYNGNIYPVSTVTVTLKVHYDY